MYVVFSAAACRAAPPPQKGICGRRIFWLPIFHLYDPARGNVPPCRKKVRRLSVMKGAQTAYNTSKACGRRRKGRGQVSVSRRPQSFRFHLLANVRGICYNNMAKKRKVSFYLPSRLSGARKHRYARKKAPLCAGFTSEHA